MDYSNKLAGSSLIPLEIISKSILGFLFLMLIVHVIVSFFHRGEDGRKKLGRTKKIGGGIIAIAIFLGLSFGLYWLVPPPHVIKTYPETGTNAALQDKGIEIIFDRPVSRSEMKKTISPEVPGVWVFEKPTYNTHLTRKVVFYPQETLMPNTEYTVTLSGVTNTVRWSKPYSFEFAFSTHKPPTVEKVVPVNGEKLENSGEISVQMSAPVEGSLVEFDFFPTIAFDTSISQDRKTITVIPKGKMEPAAHYLMRVYLAETKQDLATNERVEVGELKQVYEGSFQVEGLNEEASFLPAGGKVAVDDTIAVRFVKPMDQDSVRRNFYIEPKVNGKITWADDYLMVFSPERYAYDTEYTVMISKSARTITGDTLKKDVLGHFTTLGEVGVEKVTPGNGDIGVGINTPIKITLNQEVNKISAESNFSLSPRTEGEISWLGRTMIFTPSKPLNKNSIYKITLNPGVRSLKGRDSEKGFVAAFSTTQTTFKLPVPAFLQQHSLSCEVASLRMALAYRGIHVTEEELLGRVGFDPTPHSNGVWGNPYNAFVGNVDGKQMTTGYGVYWGPIARVARGYTQAEEFGGWTTQQLLTEVSKGNPVIIWGYSGSGRTVYWNTPSGEKIHAVGGEHTYVVTGFVGSPENPSRIIVNDSLVGQVYMTRTTFERKWKSFENSGVVVF